eukprot:NODE_218_length_12464_cov_0.653781.p7 type:complete len:278 gc:universal NODE_218_length_12464_cov_0.653781:2925-2092(-)
MFRSLFPKIYSPSALSLTQKRFNQIHKVATQENKVAPVEEDYLLMHPVYSTDYVKSIKPKHLKPEKWHQKVGFYGIKLLRGSFDLATGYPKNMNEHKWLQRMIFLETVAGCPGMVAASLRHLRSLRLMKRDNAWIHTLLEEAENERMHLLTFLKIKQPTGVFRAMVILTQGLFYNIYFLAYLLSPKVCHAMVGYLEEEAVKTYTHALKDIEEGNLWKDRAAPEIAIHYWRLEKDATMKDVIYAIRADEATHSHVNHSFSVMKPDEKNPFSKNSHMIP